MPRPPLPGPDSSNQDRFSTPLRNQEPAATSETSLAELADTFSARVPDPALAADLALQIVLNEIAAQACLTTGATGAAIALERDGELVCRASSGSTAPELGAPLNSKQGLSGECVRTRQIQVYNDIESDPRADPTASQQLGARSVMMVPLLRGENVVGVLEAFSSVPGAFGQQDQRSLEAMAQRVLHNVELAGVWSAATGKAVRSDRTHALDLQSDTSHSSEDEVGSSEVTIPDPGDPAPGHGLRILTYALGVVVTLAAIGLWARIFDRLGWLKEDVRSPAAVAAPLAGGNSVAVASSNSAGSVRVGDIVPPSSVGAASTAVKQAAVEPAAAGKSSGTKPLAPGSLAVYDHGKEVFRMVPGGQAAPDRPAGTPKSAVRQAVSIEPERSVTGTEQKRLSSNLNSTSDVNLLRRVEPNYPEQARQAKIQGAVVLDVRAGVDGFVQQVTLVSGHPLLAAAAIAAVNQWQFRPRVVNGQSTYMETRVTLDFKLPN